MNSTFIKDCSIPRPIPYRTPEEREELARRWKLREEVPPSTETMRRRKALTRSHRRGRKTRGKGKE